MVTKDVPSSLPGKEEEARFLLVQPPHFCLFSFLLIESLLYAKHCVGIEYECELIVSLPLQRSLQRELDVK